MRSKTAPAKHRLIVPDNESVRKAPASRQAVFISHATPEDNRFTIWLGAKLTALGYEVWSDVQRLRGGDDWERILENALRERAAKVLFVGTAAGASKQGVRNEIQIATDVGKKIGDKAFIIPLRLESYDAPFLIVHRQYIDFTKSWATGLEELLSVLDEAGIVRSDDQRNNFIWRDLQQLDGTALVAQPEQLLSTWLRIRSLPQRLKIYDVVSGSAIEASAIRALPWPAVPYGNGFLSFASAADLGSDVAGERIRQVDARATDILLESGWPQRGLSPHDARRYFSDLARQAMESTLAQAGLTPFALGSRRTAWWPMLTAAPKDQIRFRWGSTVGRRQIQGISGKRKLFWHYGVSASIRTSPLHHVQLNAHIIFSTDGRTPLGDAGKMHRARRSFTKTWRNARWRDMLLAFLSWLSKGESVLAVPVGTQDALWLELPPIQFVSPLRSASDLAPTEENESEDELDDLAADDIIFDERLDDEEDFEVDDDD